MVAWFRPPLLTWVVDELQWGAVEHGVEQYKWSGYRKLFEKVRQYNLKVQVVMSFHSCGGNVGDDVNINLPKFVDEVRQHPLTHRVPVVASPRFSSRNHCYDGAMVLRVHG